MNEPLKVGVIGAGYLGKFHIENWKSIADAKLVGFFDPDQKNAIAVQPDFCIQSPYTPLEAQQAMHAFCDKGIQIDGLFAASDLIAINAGAGLLVSGKTSTLVEGVRMAQDAIKSGAALSKLQELIELTNRLSRG